MRAVREKKNTHSAPNTTNGLIFNARGQFDLDHLAELIRNGALDQTMGRRYLAELKANCAFMLPPSGKEKRTAYDLLLNSEQGRSLLFTDVDARESIAIARGLYDVNHNEINLRKICDEIMAKMREADASSAKAPQGLFTTANRPAPQGKTSASAIQKKEGVAGNTCAF